LTNKVRILNLLSKTPIKVFFKSFYSGDGSILFLHKIIPSSKINRQRISLMKGNELEVTFLEQLIKFLIKKDYEFISLDELNIRLKNKEKKRKKFIAFTFDDGYKDNYLLAYPLFKKYNIPFAIYVTNCYPNHTAKLWWYMLEDIILENDKVEILVDKTRIYYNCVSQKEKDKAFVSIRRHIISTSSNEQAQMLNYLETKYEKNLKSYVKKEALSWDEINKLSKDNLVTIGSHTLNHFALNRLSNKELLREIKESKEELERKTGKKVNHFAYPYGTDKEIGGREVNLVKTSNLFVTATTTRLGNVFLKHRTFKHALPRVQIIGTEQALNITELYLSGVLPAIKNKLKKIVTL
jgi:peptidoglycan/xylan/chitin deacetylase (PgdA/CDA1 family)